MGTQCTTSASLLLALSIVLVSSLTSAFSPADNHLINCGSPVDAILDTRRFVSDFHSSNPATPLRCSSLTTTVVNGFPQPGSDQIYHTARAFRKPTKYAFKINQPGTHMVRLHFSPFVSSNLDLTESRFHVLVGDYVVLTNFTTSTTLVKEYFIWTSKNKLVISFVPTEKGKLGFVNAIEVISAPKDLIADTATLLTSGKADTIQGLSKQGLETVHRVNVGGRKVTPFNDSVWRTWIPDDGFFKTSDVSNKVSFSGRINYQVGGASRQVCPDFVYNSARVIASKNSSIPVANMTWAFPLTGGYRYLVRLHFCDIASISLGLLRFNVYINGQLANEDLDLSSISYELASPYYADFVVETDDSEGDVSISVGHSHSSMAYAVDGILNGVEIMRMNNSMGSFDGKMCAGMALKSWPRGNSGGLFALAAVMCLLLSVSLIMRRRMVTIKESVSWSKLDTEVPEVNLKGDQFQSSFDGKV
ncbi:Probable receptor-like protein kinase At5g24010 [Linum grandiflorum]